MNTDPRENFQLSPEDAPAQLPEGIKEGADGTFEARCCCCGKWTELYCDLQDIPESGYKHYCGGSPRCCP